MKQLTKEEMKKIIGGQSTPTVDTVECNDGFSLPHPDGDCRCGSVGLCDGNGGVKDCIAYGHPVTAQ
ncbi:MAG: bacteriocin [Chitinophagaceae bacterium]|nr:bacteriocin [Chitinophagaceae bacterium]